MTHDIRVHFDRFTYTREGLRLDEKLRLRTNHRNRVILERPEKREPVPATYAGFAHDSAFPTVSVLGLLLVPALQSLLSDLFLRTDGSGPRPYFQVFGHADVTGQDDHNKLLSERRAKVVAALLRGDWQQFTALAREESWGLDQHQMMLRVLRCDPGPIDGLDGPLTGRAVRLFVDEYLDGIFHRHLAEDPAQPDLDGDRGLTDAVVQALYEAFVLACSPRLPPEQMHPTHPVIGCSEFNPIVADEHAANRRVSLVIHPTLPPHHDRAPCVEGETSPCALFGEHQQRCLWYRMHIDEAPPRSEAHHFDLRWLRLDDGRLHLSALTTLPDGEPVSFQLFRSGPVGDLHDDLEADAVPLASATAGEVLHGVAQAVLDPPHGLDFDFDLWDIDTWYEVAPGLTPEAAWEQSAVVRVPFFRVEGGGSTSISQPPGDDLGRLRARLDPEAADPGSPPANLKALDGFGRILDLSLTSGLLDVEYSPVWLGERNIQSIRSPRQRAYITTEEPDGY